MMAIIPWRAALILSLLANTSIVSSWNFTGLAVYQSIFSGCRSSPCTNDGVCLPILNTYFCLCPVGWQGSDCSQEDATPACMREPCMNGGTCTPNVIGGGFTCWCDGSWFGTNCTQQTITHEQTSPIPIAAQQSTTHSTTRVNGGELIGSTGRLSNSTYAREYLSNQFTIWHIVVDSRMNVDINITDIDIEYSDICELNYLAFYSGRFEEGNSTPPAIQKVCGSTPPPIFTMTNNTVAIVFHTHINASRQSFSFTWRAVLQNVSTTTLEPPLLTPSATCNYQLIAEDEPHEFTTPEYPSKYDNDLNCQWTIKALCGVVSLSFTAMDLEKYTDCIYDRVIILDGSTIELDRICEVRLVQPLNYTSTGDVMTVKFLSDSSVNGPGFRAVYRQVVSDPTQSAPCSICNHHQLVATETQQELRSPNYPFSYYPNIDCQRTITAPSGVVFLSFTAIGIRRNDRIILLEGTHEIRRIGRRELISPFNYTSAGSILTIKFRTGDGSVNAPGFRALYRTTPQACGGLLSSSSGIIMSPNFPRVYPHDIECIWIINAERDQKIRLSFNSFLLEFSRDCEFDYVMVIGASTSLYTRYSRYCGEIRSHSITSTINTMIIRFKSDSSIAANGFNLSYTIGDHDL